MARAGSQYPPAISLCRPSARKNRALSFIGKTLTSTRQASQQTKPFCTHKVTCEREIYSEHSSHTHTQRNQITHSKSSSSTTSRQHFGYEFYNDMVTIVRLRISRQRSVKASNPFNREEHKQDACVACGDHNNKEVQKVSPVLGVYNTQQL